MARPKKDLEPMHMLLLRLPKSLVKEIDNRAGRLPRTYWIEQACRDQLELQKAGIVQGQVVAAALEYMRQKIALERLVPKIEE